MPLRSVRLQSVARLIAVPLLVYTLAALFITWPLATQMSTHIAGAGYSDSYEYVRLSWWGKYALQHGLNPFYQSLFGYPGGFFSAVQWAQPLIYWPTAILGFVFSPVTAFNLWLLIEVILSGHTAFWLCRAVLADSPTADPDTLGSYLSALVGGLVFMAFPAMQGHIVAGHVNPLSNYALPVLALCLYRIVRLGWWGKYCPRLWPTAILGGLALWIMALGNFTFPAFALLPLILFGGGFWLLARRDQVLRGAVLRNLLILFVVGGALITPFYVPLFNDLTATVRPVYLQETGWVRYSTDPLAFIAPSPFVPWLASVAPAYSRTVLGTNSTEGTAYLGMLAVILAAVALWRRKSQAAPWLVIALGCMLFSLGPLLKWQDQPVTYQLGDYESYITLPWAFFQKLPLLNGTRTPGRFNMTTGLALGVLAALGLSVVLGQIARIRQQNQTRRYAQIGLAALVTALMLGEYQLFWPFPTVPAGQPAYFSSLAERADVRAVFDVPWDDLLAQKLALYQQTVHQKPLLAGYISRQTPVDPARVALLSDLVLDKLPQSQSQMSLDGDVLRQALKANDADVVVIHLGLLGDARNIILLRAATAFGPAVYSDDQIAVFEVPAPANTAAISSATAAPLFTRSASGWWQPPSSKDDAAALGKSPASAWLTGPASLYVYNPSSAVLDQQVTLQFSPLIRSQRLRLSVDGRLSRAWPISADATTIPLWLRFSPGFHTLTFTLPDGCTPVPVVPACLLYDTDPAKRSAASCALPAPSDPDPSAPGLCVAMLLRDVSVREAGSMAAQPRPVQLSNGMRLNSFRAPEQAIPGQPLTVETSWTASQKLPGDYHLFIHVLDQSGKLVAQADTVPGQQTYPTTAWSVPQDWSEALAVPLPADLPAGQYSLYAGWYAYPDLTRLGVEGDAPHAADGLVYLRDVTMATR